MLDDDDELFASLGSFGNAFESGQYGELFSNGGFGVGDTAEVPASPSTDFAVLTIEERQVGWCVCPFFGQCSLVRCNTVVLAHCSLVQCVFVQCILVQPYTIPHKYPIVPPQALQHADKMLDLHWEACASNMREEMTMNAIAAHHRVMNNSRNWCVWGEQR